MLQMIKVFQNSEFGEIRTVTIDNEPWFVGKDVAEALGYKDTADAIRSHVYDDDKKHIKVGEIPTLKTSNYGAQLVNESGIYSLIFGSKLDSAKRFKHWVTSEVLPAIRKTGSYKVPTDPRQQIQLLAQGYTDLAEKVDSVDNDLQNFKMEMPVFAIDLDRIKYAKHKKVIPLLGGKQSNAYKNRSLVSRVYKDLEVQLRREFGVGNQKEIKRNQTDTAIEIINNYTLPMALANEIEAENNQQTFSF